MTQYVEPMLNCLATVLMDDRPEEVAKNFAFPLPLYYEGGLVVFGSAHTFAEALAMFRDAMIAAGIVRLEPRIVAQGLPAGGYMNVWIEWDHYDAAGQIVRVSQVHYVAHTRPGLPHPTVEMIDYTVAAFPELADQLPLAQCA